MFSSEVNVGLAARFKGGLAAVSRVVRKAFSWNSSFGDSAISGQDRYATRRNSAQWLEVFRRNSRVRGPVNRIAEDVSLVRFRLYRKLG